MTNIPQRVHGALSKGGFVLTESGRQLHSRAWPWSTCTALVYMHGPGLHALGNAWFACGGRGMQLHGSAVLIQAGMQLHGSAVLIQACIIRGMPPTAQGIAMPTGHSLFTLSKGELLQPRPRPHVTRTDCQQDSRSRHYSSSSRKKGESVKYSPPLSRPPNAQHTAHARDPSLYTTTIDQARIARLSASGRNAACNKFQAPLNAKILFCETCQAPLAVKFFDCLALARQECQAHLAEVLLTRKLQVSLE